MSQLPASTAKTKRTSTSLLRQRQCAAGILFLVASTVLIVSMVAHAKSKKDAADAREKALKLFQKALAVSDIRATNSQPFALRGVIEIPEGHGKSAKGVYSLLWAAPDRWREGIQFTNYSRVRIGGKDNEWQLRSIDYEVLPVFDFDSAFGYVGELRHFAQPDSIKGLEAIRFEQKKVAGAKTDCALLTESHDVQFDSASTKYKTTRTYCFNPSNGALASTGSSADRHEATEYSDFVAFAGKAVPSTIVAHGNDVTVVFHMSQIVPLGNVDPKMFVPPPGAQEWDTYPLETLKESKLVTQTLPIYPHEAKTAHIEGRVVVYAVVGTDGLLHKMQILASSSPLLAGSAVQALQGWRYEPAVCGSKPIAHETILTIVYNLGS